jgi:hypothetical protein
MKLLLSFNPTQIIAGGIHEMLHLKVSKYDSLLFLLWSLIISQGLHRDKDPMTLHQGFRETSLNKTSKGPQSSNVLLVKRLDTTVWGVMEVLGAVQTVQKEKCDAPSPPKNRTMPTNAIDVGTAKLCAMVLQVAMVLQLKAVHVVQSLQKGLAPSPLRG